MSGDIVVGRFVNHADVNKQDNLTLCSEWKGNTCNVYIFGRNIALRGELSEILIEQFSSNLSKSSECYIEETKQNFSFKDTDVQFYLQDEKFRWKKAMWNHGYIKMCPIKCMKEISEFQQKLLMNFEYFQKNIDQMMVENRILSSNQTEWEQKFNELIQVKQIMENELYKKFLLVLNKKKERIRELEGLLKSKEKANEIYEEQTDDSQDLIRNCKRRKTNMNRLVQKRMRVSDDSSELSDLYCKKETEKPINKELFEKEKEKGKEKEDRGESSSTNVSTPREEESSTVENKKKESTQTRIDDESDDDICLKLTDESDRSAERNQSKFQNIRRTIIESESDDDLFL